MLQTSSLIYQPAGEYFYLGSKGPRSGADPIFNILFNFRCTDSETHYPCETFSYIAGEKKQLLRGLTSYFLTKEIAGRPNLKGDPGIYATAKLKAETWIASLKHDIVIDYKHSAPSVYEVDMAINQRDESSDVEDLVDLEDYARDL